MNQSEKRNKYQRKPDWLKIKLPQASEYAFLKDHLKRHNLHTICESGNCPNLGECWALKTATFMILGNICTRNCRFCSVEKGRPLPAEKDEPQQIADAVRELGIRHCVLTSVTRDDISDGGASIWADTIRTIQQSCPETRIEALIPDLNGKKEDILKIIDSKPDVISHNIETVKRLTPLIRIKAKYDISLNVLSFLSSQGCIVKSGIMVGLGESDKEIIKTIHDIASTGCNILTIGQYLQPGLTNHPVERYVSPDQFNIYKNVALQMGFASVESAPLVRSSYHAEKHISSCIIEK